MSSRTQRNRSNAIAPRRTTQGSQDHARPTQQRDHPNTIEKIKQPNIHVEKANEHNCIYNDENVEGPRRIQIYTPNSTSTITHNLSPRRPHSEEVNTVHSSHTHSQQFHCMPTTTKKKRKPTTASRISVYCVRKKGRKEEKKERRLGRRREPSENAKSQIWTRPPFSPLSTLVTICDSSHLPKPRGRK